jgi:hypothetical protein
VRIPRGESGTAADDAPEHMIVERSPKEETPGQEGPGISTVGNGLRKLDHYRARATGFAEIAACVRA